MKHQRLWICSALWLTAVTPLWTTAMGSPLLIEETEKLRRTLPRKDKQQKRALTLKLANQYYGEAIKQAADNPESATNQQKVNKMRQRSLDLFKEYISGDNGDYEKASGEPLAIAQFQMARLYTDLGQIESAVKLWETIVKADEYPNIVAESALSLAEYYEAKDPASKQALNLYAKALQGEVKHDTQIYVHYRSAWILRNQEKYPEAIEHLRQSMLDSRGQVKDEVVADLIVFYSGSNIEPDKAIEFFETLSEQIHQPDLVKKLGEAYLAAGKKPAAILVLKSSNDKSPDLLTQVRLMEEAYGARQWDLFTDTLDGVKPQLPKDPKLVEKINLIMKRLIVQLDSERQTTKDTTPHFIATAELFLKMFPADPIAFKTVQSVIGAQSTPDAQMAYISKLVTEKPIPLAAAQIYSLQEQLLGIYQKAQKHTEAAALAAVLAKDSGKPKEERRYQFVQASALFDAGKVVEALPLFDALAKADAQDDIGMKSLMIVVREAGKAKQYEQVVQVAKPWLAKNRDNKTVAASKEYAAVHEVFERSEFEWATQHGDSPESLAVFMRYCQNKQFVPQSCSNAKGMAARIKEFPTLITLLKAENAQDELATLYEENGHFVEAAKYHEQKTLSGDKASTTDYLKVALFYEIAGDKEARDRVQQKLFARISKQKFASADEEALIMQTAQDQNLVQASLLNLPWSEENRCMLLNQLSDKKPDPKLTKALLSCKVSPGKAWHDAVIAEVKELEAQQAKIGFYGNSSERKFKRRLAGIKILDERITKYLKAADAATAQDLAAIGKNSYEKLQQEILATPIPKETPADQMAQVQQALTEMAEPFQKKSAAYGELIKPAEATTAVASTPAAHTSQAVSQAEVNSLIQQLNKDPENRQALQALYSLYKTHDNTRIAAYFEGRISRLEGKN